MTQRWSYTRFNAAESCLRSYANRYEVPYSERLPDLYEPLREVGKGVHKCIEFYKDHLKSIDAAQDLTVVSLIVEDYFSTDPEVISTEHFLDVLLVFRAFAERYRHNPQKYLGGEFLTNRELPESDVIVEGYPDHIEEMTDAEGEIIVASDVKAGYSTTVTAANRLQGEIEAWKLLEWFPDRRVGWRVEWPRAGTQSPIYEFRPMYAQALEARLRSVVARVETARAKRHWPAQPGSSCAYCPLATNCRERTVLAEHDVIVSDRETAKKAAAELVLLSAAYDQRREQVKAWVEHAGPIPAGTDLEAGFVKKTAGDTIGDPLLMIAALGSDHAELGEDAALAAGVRIAVEEKLLSINGNRTKTKAVKNDPRLNGLWVPGETKTAFELYKVEREEEIAR